MCGNIKSTGRQKRYGYLFTWYVGDHLPIHIHVYKDNKLVCRWQLFEEKELTGKANAKIKKAIDELKNEGVLKVLERLKDEN